GDLRTGGILLLDALDHSHGHSLAHVPRHKPSKGWILGEGFYDHGLHGNHLHKASITFLQELRLLFKLLSGSPVDLGEELSKLDCYVGGVANLIG
ncbi:unnamed protein product, partial [Musa acuminata var. zebrina]